MRRTKHKIYGKILHCAIAKIASLSRFLVNRRRECVTDLDTQSEMIIFESILTTVEESIIFEAAGAVVKINSSL